MLALTATSSPPRREEQMKNLSVGHIASVGLFLMAMTAPAGAQEWKPACSEGEVCSIDGVRLIRYGAGETFAYGVATNQLICSNETFGDPAVGVGKACWYQETEMEAR